MKERAASFLLFLSLAIAFDCTRFKGELVNDKGALDAVQSSISASDKDFPLRYLHFP